MYPRKCFLRCCLCVCMCVCVHAHTCVNVILSVCACIYVCMHVCIIWEAGSGWNSLIWSCQKAKNLLTEKSSAQQLPWLFWLKIQWIPHIYINTQYLFFLILTYFSLDAKGKEGVGWIGRFGRAHIHCYVYNRYLMKTDSTDQGTLLNTLW